MWIELTHEVIDIIKEIENPLDKNIRAINALFNSMHNRQHIVFAEQRVLKEILKHKLISQTNKVFINSILDRYMSFYAGWDLVKHKVIVSHNNTIARQDTIFTVSLEDLIEIGKTKLITENIKDAELFINIYYCMFPENTSYDIRFDNYPCHGGNIASCMQQAVRDGFFTLCIVDSDREYENGSRGSTSTAAHRAYNSMQNNIIFLHELNVREKENLIPPDLYDLVCNLSILHIIKQYISNENFIKYANIKDGIKYKKIIDSSNSGEKWRACYMDFVEKCKEEGLYDYPDMSKSHKEIENFVCIKGIGSNPVDLVNEIILNRDKQSSEEAQVRNNVNNNIKINNIRNSITKNVPQYLLDEWKNIAEILFSWGIVISKVNLPFYTV